MEDISQEWHYTSGDGQAGPVSFDELKAMADSGVLHPRNDLAWCRGMDEWKPAGEIDGLFARKSAEGGGMSAVEAQVRKDQEVATEGATRRAFAEVDLWPGATRRWYLLMVYVFPVFWLVVALAFAKFVGTSLPPSFQKLFLMIGIIVPVWAVIDTSLTRLSNLGMSKLWFLGYFIPILNLWIAYRSFACPAGYAKTKSLDGLGWILAILYWLMVVGSGLSAVLVPATLAAMWNDPEFQERIGEWKEQVEKTRGDAEEPDGGKPEDADDELQPAP